MFVDLELTLSLWHKGIWTKISTWTVTFMIIQGFEAWGIVTTS